jgi:hypothetical protein
MRRIFVLLMLLIPITAWCSHKQKPLKIPVSRWREVTRLNVDSVVLPFSDTMFILFEKKDSFSYHNKDGFIYNGIYTINDDSLLDFGTARYKVEVRNPNLLVLSNDMGIFRFNRDLSDTVAIIVIPKNDTFAPVKSIDDMIGHWTVYKRTEKDQAGGAMDVATTIRAVYITGPSTDGKQGYIFSGNDPGNSPSWYIKNLGADQALDCAGKNPRIINVKKCQKGEMILEENGVTYYLKEFK